MQILKPVSLTNAKHFSTQIFYLNFLIFNLVNQLKFSIVSNNTKLKQV